MKPSLKQKMLQMKKYAALLVMAAIIFSFFNLLNFFIPVRTIYPQTLQEELDKVKKEKEETQKKIEEAKKAETEYMKQVNQVENNLVTALSQLDELNKKLGEAKSELDRITIDLVINDKELSETENELKDKISILNSRVASIYKNKNYSVLELLFEPGNFLKLFSKFKLMGMLAKQDVQIVNEITEKRDQILEVKKHIENLKKEEKNQKETLEKLVSQAEDKERQIEGIYGEKKQLLGQAKANKNALINMEKQLEAREAEITKKLEALRYGIAPGSLVFPVRGILTSGFGNRISPISGTMAFHAGVDIGCDTGTPIVAAADGEVIQAGYMVGYGNEVIIYHGGGFATFYGHMSSFAVSQGQKVKKGQIIGYVGSTGYSTGPHLHFELRINGEPKNPLNFF
jgi:murein DD-endopeptidase MepM/ murein hydrolase activator NlpD